VQAAKHTLGGSEHRLGAWRQRKLPRMPGCLGGKQMDGAAAPGGVHPRYVPERGQVLRGVLGALFGCFRPAKTRPLPR